MAARSRWDRLGPREEAVQTIVAAMARLCPRSFTWINTPDRPVNSLWGRLAERILDVNDESARTWLRIIFVEDRNKVQVILELLIT